MRNFIFSILVLFAATTGQAQLRNSEVHKLPEMSEYNVRDVIRIPDIDGFVTLRCDFHIHTVFSDGLVWPTVRVDEAWNDGLDVIAITDHIEYRPRKDMVIGDLNQSAEIAIKHGNSKGIMVIRGIEITRNKPFGHMNALFIEDAEKMQVKDQEESLEEALRQGAFIMWNHPGWPDDKSTLYPIHEKLIAEKKIHGVEVFNDKEYYPVSLGWCRQYNLTFLGNSDIHNTIKHNYTSSRMARPMTLVFAEQKSEASVREALFAGRTAVYFNQTLAGRPDILEKLIDASLTIRYTNEKNRQAEIYNCSDIDFVLRYGGNDYRVPGGKIISVKLPEDGKAVVTNCLTGENEHLHIDLKAE